MSTISQLEAEVKKARKARRKASELLKHQFSPAEKEAVFQEVYQLAQNWLKESMNGSPSHHVTDAFEPTVLTAIWGDDLYDWCYDLAAE